MTHTEDSIESQLGIIKSQSRTIKSIDDRQEQHLKSKIIKDIWKNILPRLEQFQRYFERLTDIFLIDKKGIMYEQLLNANDNYRQIYKEMSEIIHMDTIIENSERIYGYVNNQLLPNFFSNGDSQLYKLFLDFTTTNVLDIWNTAFNGIKNIKKPTPKEQLHEINKLTIQFPKLFLSDVLFAEIKKNFRHADENNEIVVQWEIDRSNNCLNLRIENTIKNDDEKGGRNGTQILETLKGHFDFSFEKPRQKGNTFIQLYKFKFYYHGSLSNNIDFY
jgi:hypothetical protein